MRIQSSRIVICIVALVVLLFVFSTGKVTSTSIVYAAVGNWDLNGNAGIDPATNFLGTVDNFLLTLRVNNTVGWRLIPAGTGTPNVVGGSIANQVSNEVTGASIGGGGDTDRDNNALKNVVCDDFGTVAGGLANTAGDCATEKGSATASVGGGNHNGAFGLSSTIAGGWSNIALAETGSIGGGYNNRVEGKNSTVGGGSSNKALDVDATVGGGTGNVAGEEASVVGGGSGNTISAAAGTIGGGSANRVGNFFGTVGGGDSNDAGGEHGTIAGGWLNDAIGASSTVGGGWTNRASGNYATVPGGARNVAKGMYSVAMGNRAKANENGTFVFADSNNFNFPGNTPNSFRVRATGGVRFVVGIDGTGATTWSCLLNNGTSWSCSSDRNAKENFVAVDGNAVLERLREVPILQWNAKGQDPNLKHFGPMAQDFYAAFGLGDDDKTISTIDLDGVALAAIQSLYDRSRAQEETIAVQEKRIQGLEARLAALEQADRLPTAEPSNGLVWLAPALLAGLVLVGGGFYFRRRLK